MVRFKQTSKNNLANELLQGIMEIIFDSCANLKFYDWIKNDKLKKSNAFYFIKNTEQHLTKTSWSYKSRDMTKMRITHNTSVVPESGTMSWWNHRPYPLGLFHSTSWCASPFRHSRYGRLSQNRVLNIFKDSFFNKFTSRKFFLEVNLKDTIRICIV